MTLSRADRHRIQQIARGRSDEPLRLLEGPKAIHDALVRRQVAEIWIRNDVEPAQVAEVTAGAKAVAVPIYGANPAEFDRLGNTVSPQGVFALVHDVAVPLEEVLEPGTGLVLWLDEVQDPGNVGAIFRVAAAFGVTGVLVGSGSADPLGNKALRASAGLALRVPLARANPAAIATACLASERPIWTLEAAGRPVHGIEAVPGNLILALGSEGHGFGTEVRRVASGAVGIEMAGGVESLNVAVATGIAVSTLLRGQAGGA